MKTFAHGPVISLFLLGFGYVVVFILTNSVKDLWLDEIFTFYQVSGHDSGSLGQSFLTGVNNLPPGYFILLWMEGGILGETPFALRLPSLLCALVSIVFTYRMLRLFFGRPTSSVTVLTLFCFSAELHQQSVEARPYSMYFMLSVLAAYCACRLMRDEYCSGRLLAAVGVLAFLLPFTHYYGGIYSAVLLGTAVIMDLREGRWRWRVYLSYLGGWVVFCLLGFAVFLAQMALIQVRADAGLLGYSNHIGRMFGLYANLMLFPIPLLIFLVFLVMFPVGQAGMERGRRTFAGMSGVLLAMSGWLLVPALLILLAKLELLEVAAQVKYFLPTSLSLAFFLACGVDYFLGHGEGEVRGSRGRYVLSYSLVCLGFLLLNTLRYNKAFRAIGLPTYYATVIEGRTPVFVNDNTTYYHLSYFGRRIELYKVTDDASYVSHVRQFSGNLKCFNFKEGPPRFPELLYIIPDRLNPEDQRFMDLLKTTYSMTSKKALGRHTLYTFTTQKS